MATTQEVLSQQAVSVVVLLEVQKADGTWYSLADRITHDRLVASSGFGGSMQRAAGSFDVSASTLTLDNRDGWWNGPPPAGIATWRRALVRLRAVLQSGTVTLGYWIIADLASSDSGASVDLTLSGLSKRLIDKQADRCRDGEGWYVNRPVSFLVRELLGQEYPRATIQGWSGNGRILTRYQIPLSNPSDKALSTYGRPPEFDAYVWRDDNLTPFGNAMLTIPAGTAGAAEDLVVFGLDNELWGWRVAKDTWVQLGVLPPAHASKKIMHLFLNTVSGHETIVVVAWEPDVPGANEDRNADRSGAKGGDVAMFWCPAGSGFGTGALPAYTSWPANIYTGHFFVRVGGHVTAGSGPVQHLHTVGAYSGSTAGPPNDLGTRSFGANMPLPAGAWVRRHRASPVMDGGQYMSLDPTWDTVGGQGSMDTTPDWFTRDAGYESVSYNTSAGDIRPLDYRFTCGQRAGAFAHQHAGDFMVFTVIRYDSASHTYKLRLWKLDTWNDVFTDTGIDLYSGTGLPTCMVFSPNDTKLLVGGVTWNETNWGSGATNAPANCVTGQIHEFTWSSLGTVPTVIFSSIDSTSYGVNGWLPLEVAYGSDPTRLFCAAFLNYKGMGTGSQYVVSMGDTSLGGGGSYSRWEFASRPHYSVGRPAGLLRVPGHGRIYWHEAGANVLRSFPDSAIGTESIVHDGGFPPVPEDGSLALGLVYSPQLDIVCGLSGPGEGAQCAPETMEAPLTGKYTLWQYGNFLTDRIPIADFSGGATDGTAMSLWDALEALAAVGDFVFGHDVATGDFYFLPRPTGGTPTYVLTRAPVLPGDVPVGTMDRLWGFDEVFNVAEFTPSVALLADPTGQVQLLARPAALARDTWNGALRVIAQTIRARSLYLRVTRGSQVGRGDDGAIAKSAAGDTMVDYSPAAGEKQHRLRMAYLRYVNLVETQLLVAIGVTDDTLVIPLDQAGDIQGPNVDTADGWAQTDVVTVGESGEFTVRSRTDNPGSGTCSLRLNAAVGLACAVGTKVQVRTRGNNRWSDHPDGITWLNGTVAAGSVGDTAQWTVYSTADMVPGLVLRVEPQPGGTPGTAEEVRVLSVDSPTLVTVRRGLGGVVAAHVAKDRVKAYVAPIQNSVWPAGYLWGVGGSGIFLQFTVPTSGEMPFMEGDTITLSAPGLTLQSLDQAKQVSYDQTSIDKAGGSKTPFTETRSSPFLTYRQASEAAKRTVATFGSPHFRARVTGPFAYLPATFDSLGVRDAQQFPSADGVASPNGDAAPVAPDTATTLAVVLRSFNFNPITDALTMEVRAVNPHAW